MNYWSKSTLSIYRYLETMSKTIDKIVLNVGKNSNSSELQRYQTTYFQASKIIELIERKRKMINLKVACEQALNKIPLQSRKILMLFYIDGVKGDFIAQLLGISLRTFFRQKLKALKEFSEALERMGFNLNFFNPVINFLVFNLIMSFKPTTEIILLFFIKYNMNLKKKL